MFGFFDIIIIIFCFLSWYFAGDERLKNEELISASAEYMLYFRFLFGISILVFIFTSNSLESIKCFLLSVFCYLIHIVNNNAAIGRELKTGKENLEKDIALMVKKAEEKKEE